MPTNLLPQLIPSRLVKARARLRDRMYARVEPLTAQMGPMNDRFLSVAEAQNQEFIPITPGSVFGPGHGAWKQRWFRVEVPAPLPGEEGRRHLRWDVQGETTAYLDGKPWAGLDVAHRHCPLPDRACTLWLDGGLWVTAMWVPGSRGIDAFGPRFDGCFLAVRDQAVWDAYWDLDGLLQLLARLYRRNETPLGPSEGSAQFKPTHERADPLLRMLLRAADEAVDHLDTAGVAAFRTAMHGIYTTFHSPGWAPTAAIIGMAHIDLVWLWPEQVAERKGIHSFATQLRLMERYPEYVFNQSQPALNRAIDRLEPHLAAEVAERVREGRWDLTGGFEVECDSILPCGEALARCLAIGQRQFLGRTGSYSTLAWLPDAFGFSNALPQILALGGVTRFYTAKLNWSAVHRFPYHSFVWRGADGSEVLAHSCSSIYNQMVEADALGGNLDDHRQVDVHPEMLVCVGWGDGGGGTSEDQIERARRFANLAGMPKVRWSASGAFFDRLEAVRHRLPSYQGELYLEGTRGCFTTQGEFKRLYRRAETALQTHEAVRVALGGVPLDERSWQRVSFLQFHDALPGSSIRDVYDQAGPELQAIGDHALAAAAAELTAEAPDGGELVFNPLPVPRREVVELPRGAIPTQVLTQDAGGDRALVLLDLPALGTARPNAALTPVHPVMTTPTRLSNSRVCATFDENGRLVSLDIDGRQHRLERPSGLCVYEDVPGSFDAWEIYQAAGRLGQAIATQAPLTVATDGPLRGILHGSLLVGSSPAIIEYRLDADSPHLRVRLRIDWREEHRLLKFHLSTGYRGRFARFGAPFGSTLRPQLPGLSVDEAMWEVPGSRWAAVTDDHGTGLALIAEARYGFSCRDGDLALSLLRRPRHPAVGNDAMDTGPFTDGGSHDLQFAVGAYQSVNDPSPGTALAADTLFTPPLIAVGGRDLTTPFHLSDLGTLTPSWVLPAAGGGIILRLHETAGASGCARLLCPGSTVTAVDFLERDLPLHPTIDADGTLRLPYRPYGILSLRIHAPSHG